MCNITFMQLQHNKGLIHFFLLISKNFIRKRKRERRIIRCVQTLFKEYKSQINRVNQINKWRWKNACLKHKSNQTRNAKICSLITKIEHSTPSNTRLFISYHRFRMTERGKARHTIASLRSYYVDYGYCFFFFLISIMATVITINNFSGSEIIPNITSWRNNFLEEITLWFYF